MSQEKPEKEKGWQGWGWIPEEWKKKSRGDFNQEPSELEDPLGALKLPGSKLPRVVHWRSHTGKWVVVCGPFPDRFYRSETRDSPEKAAKLPVDHIVNRAATTLEDQYAKVLASDILEISGGENEFGPISP